MLTWLNWLANNRFADTNKNVDSPSSDGEFSFKMGIVKIHKNKRKNSVIIYTHIFAKSLQNRIGYGIITLA